MNFTDFDLLTVSMRIVAEYGTQNFQFTMKLERATNLKFTAVLAIIFIHLLGFRNLFKVMYF